jgi:hypothetical protein
MYPAIDKTTLATKDYNKILAVLTTTYEGSAKTVADNDPWTKLKNAFGEVSESLGGVLLPFVKDFATYMITDVIPNIELWIEANRGKLQDSLRATGETLKAITENLVILVGFFTRFKDILLVLAAVPALASLLRSGILMYKIYKKVMPVIEKIFSIKTLKTIQGIGTGVGLITGAFKANGFLAAIKTMFQIFMMMSPWVKGITIALLLAKPLISIFKGLYNGIAGGAEKTKLTNEEIAKQNKEAILAGYKQVTIQMEKAKNDKIAADNLARNTAIQKKADADAKKRAKIEADVLKKQLTLKGLLGKKVAFDTSEITDEKQLNAAILLQKRQENAKKADMDRLELLKSMFKTQDDLAKLELVRSDILAEYNKNLKYQNDLMIEYQDDSKITADEIQNLADKWGISAAEVEKYSTVFLALLDEKIDSTDIQNVGKAFGIGTAEAKKYLEAVLAIKHGTLDIETLNRLATEWKVPVAEALKYIHYISQINNPTATISDAGVAKLTTTWGLTNAQLSEYIKQIGLPFNYHGSLLTGIESLIAKLKEALELIKKLQEGNSSTAG